MNIYLTPNEADIVYHLLVEEKNDIRSDIDSQEYVDSLDKLILKIDNTPH